MPRFFYVLETFFLGYVFFKVIFLGFVFLLLGQWRDESTGEREGSEIETGFKLGTNREAIAPMRILLLNVL